MPARAPSAGRAAARASTARRVRGSDAARRQPAARAERKGSGSVRERKRMAAKAVALLLDAVVPPGERASALLAGTPDLVAQAWVNDLLDGYGRDPAEILGEAMPSVGRDLVVVTGIDFHAMCPHHLLPARGVAHVGYVPNGRIVGFGQLARLVDCFSHRLALEEDVARQVAGALVEILGAEGAACALDAEQACLTTRGERRRQARAHVQCFLGTFDTEPRLQARFRELVKGARDPREAGRRRVR